MRSTTQRQAAASIQGASTASAVEQSISEVAAIVPSDLSDTLAAVNARLDDIEAQLP